MKNGRLSWLKRGTVTLVEETDGGVWWDGRRVIEYVGTVPLVEATDGDVDLSDGQ